MPTHTEIRLAADAAQALRELREAASNGQQVLVFKKSPICPISTRAEAELTAWLAEREALGFPLLNR